MTDFVEPTKGDEFTFDIPRTAQEQRLLRQVASYCEWEKKGLLRNELDEEFVRGFDKAIDRITRVASELSTKMTSDTYAYDS